MNFDVILMDVDLGPNKQDGTQAVESILEHHDIPIVSITMAFKRYTTNKDGRPIILESEHQKMFIINSTTETIPRFYRLFSDG